VHDISTFIDAEQLHRVKIDGDGIDFPKTRYIGYLSFALNYYLDGLNVIGYHILNILIHIINALLVYRLVILTFRTPFFNAFSSDKSNVTAVAFISALLFACHPVQTQAVTYIVQRLASLATLFYLLSIVSYIKSRVELSAPRRKSFYILSIVSAIFAMFTKEISFTLPLSIILCEIFFFEGSIRKRTLYLLPMVLTMLLIPLTALFSSGLIEVNQDSMEKALNSNNAIGITAKDYLFTQFRVIMTYLRLLVCPVSQNLDYDYPIYRSFSDPNVFLSLIFLLSLFGIGLFLFYRSRLKSSNAPYQRLISFGIFWFFITLTVESSIVPISDVIFEHRLYLPSAGFFIAAATSVVLLNKYLDEKKINARKVIFPIVFIIIAALSVTAYARNKVWQTDVSLWGDTAAKSPQKARPHKNLGVAYFKANRLAESEQEFHLVFRTVDFAELEYNLGLIYYMQGRLAEAIEAYKKAISLDSGYYEAYGNLGAAYAAIGKYDEAIMQFQTAIRLKPDNIENYYNLALAYENQGDVNAAARQYSLVMQRKPSLTEELNNLGVSSYKLGNMDAAIKKYRIAIILDPDMVQSHYNLALALIKLRRLNEAEKELKTALKLKPDLAGAHYHLAMSYERQGRLNNTIRELEAALKIQPDYPDAQMKLNSIRHVSSP
jgi:tetratricopeptide (TPR) repeat protein